MMKRTESSRLMRGANLYGESGSTAGLTERAVGHDGGMHVIAGEYIAG